MIIFTSPFCYSCESPPERPKSFGRAGRNPYSHKFSNEAPRSNPAGLPVERNPAPKTIYSRVNPWSFGAWIKKVRFGRTTLSNLPSFFLSLLLLLFLLSLSSHQPPLPDSRPSALSPPPPPASPKPSLIPSPVQPAI